MHRSYEGDGDPMKALAITTGPCELVKWDAETSAEVRRKDKPWWKGEFHLDGITWVDYGSDPNAMLSAFESGEIDTDHETASDAVSQTEDMGLENSEIATGSTIVARFNVGNAPYEDVKVRRAAQLAVDNSAVLKLGTTAAASPPTTTMSARCIPNMPISARPSVIWMRQRSCLPRPARPTTNSSSSPSMSNGKRAPAMRSPRRCARPD
ncbi:hypothetical protein AJ88_07205 [Mesorhizobium amorphae CCBAU 01583]|nr:hypothetical protein AJ88_07205 [Mesorhizobium amorphae CCBAU 01583]